MSELQWTDAAAVDDVPADDVIAVLVGGNEVALYSVEGNVYATTTSARTGMPACAKAFSKGTRSSARCTRASSTCATASPPARL